MRGAHGDDMRTPTLLASFASCSLLFAACADAPSEVENDLLGIGDDHDNNDDHDDNDNHDNDDGHDDTDDNGDCGSSPGCGDGGDDDSSEVDLTADLHLAIAGTGLYLGLGLTCIDLSGSFLASYDGQVMFDASEHRWHISVVDEASLHVEDDCQCSNSGISIDAIASITAHVKIAADEHGCELFCDAWAHEDASATCNSADETTTCHLDAYADAKVACSATCEASNGMITAHASLDASLDVELDSDDDELFEDLDLDLEFDDLLDSDGDVIDLD